MELTPSVADNGNARYLLILEQTTKRETQQYESKLLWRDNKVRLSETYSMTLNGLVNIELNIRRDVDNYGIMDDYVKKVTHEDWSPGMVTAVLRCREPEQA